MSFDQDNYTADDKVFIIKGWGVHKILQLQFGQSVEKSINQ